MDPDYLIFARIVEAGSLSAAGRMLAISPAMISKRLARLEARLGVQLMHRTTRKLALTEAGAQFHADVRAILAAVADAENRVADRRGEPSGALRISAPTSFGRLYVAPGLGAFVDRWPRVRLELDLSDDYVDLFDGRFDLAIRITRTRPSGLRHHRLCGSRRILCASPAYCRQHGMPGDIAALSGHRLLAATGQLPWHLVRGEARHVVGGESHVRTGSSEIVRELAIAGVGIAFRSLWDVHAMLADGRLLPVLPGWEGPTDLAVYAVHPRGLQTSAVDALVAHLRDCFPAEAERRAPCG